MVRVLIVIALAACTRTSEKYCGLHPEDLAHCPPSDAARPTCASDPECPVASPYCLLEGTTGMCVACRDDTDCTSIGKQACDPDTRECLSCVAHTDCPGSLACLPDGTCGGDADVIYVDPSGDDGGDCGVAAKCRTITYALGQVTATRYHIKLSGALAETVVIVAKRVVLLADPNTTLSGGDPTLKIQKATVSVYDLEIPCSPTGGGIKSEMTSTTVLRNVYVHGCGGKGAAIDAKGGFINITRSRVAESASGGIATDGSAVFSITNTLVYRNGTLASARGGVSIGAVTSGMNNRFEHNTIVHNRAKSAAGVAGGLACTATNFLEMPNNIIAANVTSTGVNDNTFGACDFSRSYVVVDPTELAFVSIDPPYDYHLTTNSMAIDKIDLSTVTDDFDGQFRPQGPRKDFGADEYKP